MYGVVNSSNQPKKVMKSMQRNSGQTRVLFVTLHLNEARLDGNDHVEESVVVEKKERSALLARDPPSPPESRPASNVRHTLQPPRTREYSGI